MGRQAYSDITAIPQVLQRAANQDLSAAYTSALTERILDEPTAAERDERILRMHAAQRIVDQMLGVGRGSSAAPSTIQLERDASGTATPGRKHTFLIDRNTGAMQYVGPYETSQPGASVAEANFINSGLASKWYPAARKNLLRDRPESEVAMLLGDPLRGGMNTQQIFAHLSNEQKLEWLREEREILQMVEQEGLSAAMARLRGLGGDIALDSYRQEASAAGAGELKPGEGMRVKEGLWIGIDEEGNDVYGATQEEVEAALGHAIKVQQSRIENTSSQGSKIWWGDEFHPEVSLSSFWDFFGFPGPIWELVKELGRRSGPPTPEEQRQEELYSEQRSREAWQNDLLRSMGAL